jgi:hypothetical protein
VDLAPKYSERVRDMSELWKNCENQFVAMAGPAEPTTRPARNRQRQQQSR